MINLGTLEIILFVGFILIIINQVYIIKAGFKSKKLSKNNLTGKASIYISELLWLIPLNFGYFLVVLFLLLIK